MKWSLGGMTESRAGEGKQKMNLEHLRRSESKKVLKRKPTKAGYAKGAWSRQQERPRTRAGRIQATRQIEECGITTQSLKLTTMSPQIHKHMTEQLNSRQDKQIPCAENPK